jgi:hypothetical protein
VWLPVNPADLMRDGPVATDPAHPAFG